MHFYIIYKEVLGCKMSNSKISQIIQYLLCVNSRRINLFDNGTVFEIEIQNISYFSDARSICFHFCK